MKMEHARILANLERQIRRRVPESLRGWMEEKDGESQTAGRTRVRKLEAMGVVWGPEGYLRPVKKVRRFTTERHLGQSRLDDGSQTHTGSEIAEDEHQSRGNTPPTEAEDYIESAGHTSDSTDDLDNDLEVSLDGHDSQPLRVKTSAWEEDQDDDSFIEQGWSSKVIKLAEPLRTSPRKMGLPPAYLGVPSNFRR